MRPTDFAKHLTSFFVDYLPARRSVRANTIKAYRDAFKLLLRYCQESKGLSPEKLRIKHLDAKTIVSFLGYLESERQCCKNTRNQRLAAIHSFFRYLQGESPEHMLQCQQILAIPFHRYARRTPRYLVADDLKDILSQPNLKTSSGRRDAVLLSLLYDTGARVQELIDLTKRDVRLDSPAHVRLLGKGQKIRFVPLIANSVKLLRTYLKDRGLTTPDLDDEPLFVNRMGQPLSRSGIRYILNKYVQMAHTARIGSREPISPHTIRHSKAMHLLQAGNPLIVIRDILGHVDIKTTEVYAHADIEMQRRALEKTEPLLSSSQYRVDWRKDKHLVEWLESL